MKRFLTSIAFLFGLSGVVFAGSPLYYPQGTDCISVYAVGGGTISAASCHVTVDSITFVSVGGLYPGTTAFYFFDADKDTIGELITYINTVSTTTPGVACGLVASLSQGSYEGNDSSSMTVVGAQSILTSSLAKTLTIDTIKGISYVIPRDSVDNRRINLTNLVVNATFGSGTTYLSIYDGATTDIQLRKEKIATSAVDARIDIPDEDFINSGGTALRIDLAGTVAMTSAYMNFTYKYVR